MGSCVLINKVLYVPKLTGRTAETDSLMYRGPPDVRVVYLTSAYNITDTPLKRANSTSFDLWRIHVAQQHCSQCTLRGIRSVDGGKGQSPAF